jgi:hypothetical protein
MEGKIAGYCWNAGEKRKRTRRRRREASTTTGTGMPVKKCKKFENKRKMDECRVEWKGQRYEQARKKGENQRIKVQQGAWEVYDRGNSGVPGERVSKREKTGIGWKERKGAAECTMRKEIQSSTWEMNVAKWEKEGGKGVRRNTEWRQCGTIFIF